MTHWPDFTLPYNAWTLIITMVSLQLLKKSVLSPTAAILLALAFVFSGFVATPASADILSDKVANSEGEKGTEPWQLKADKISADHDPEIIEAEGHVVLIQEKRTLRADYARYYRKTGWVYLKGNVDISWSKDRLTADEAEFDLNSRKGWLKDGFVYIDDAHLYFSGARIEKHEGDTYSFRDATVTSCDKPEDAWSFDLDKGEITIEGYAWLEGATFNVADVPVAYSPYLILPAKTKRQSGLLMPSFGTSSRNGFFYNQPIYWAIDEESDATFYENYMNLRGLNQGIEYRHTPNANTKGLWRFDWLNDKKVAKTEEQADDQFQNDGLTRPNRNRFWFRGMYNGYVFDPQWKLRMNVDYASDQDYLREFKNDLTGFEKTDDLFEREFGRDIDDSDSLTRTSTLLATRSWNRVGLATRIEYTQDFRFMNGNGGDEDDPTLQRLPELYGFVWKDRLFKDIPVEFMLDSSAGYYYRAKGDSGSRIDMTPALSAPLELGPISIIPSVAFRETLYMEGTYEDNPEADSFEARHLPTYEVTAFTEMARVFQLDNDKLVPSAENVGNSGWTAIRHAIQPRIDYTLTPYLSQKDNPFFDDVDRLPASNEITYSLTNVLDRKQERVIAKKDGDDLSYIRVADYLDFFNLRVQQSYDQREATRDNERDKYERRPFSDVLIEAIFNFNSQLSWTSRSQISPYIGDVTEHEHFLTYRPIDRFQVRFGLDFQESLDEYKRQNRKRLRQSRLGIDWAINKNWFVSMEYRADIEHSKDLEKTLRLLYREQCYGLELRLDADDNETRVEGRVTLLGLTL